MKIMVRLQLLIFVIVVLIPAVGSGSLPGLQMHGEGEARYLGFIKVYDAALYTQTPAAADKILSEDTSRCLKLDYTVSLTAKDFKRGANTILSRQHTPEKLALVRSEIDRMHNAYRDVRKGDSYSLCYEAASRATTLSLNQQELITITSADFAEIYFGIWLGPINPIDETLRNQLLTPAKTN